MRRVRLFFAACGLALCLLPWGTVPKKEAEYDGRTTSQWESEIQYWEPLLKCRGSKAMSYTLWIRREPVWTTWLGLLGIQAGHPQADLPLLGADPAAVPVLVELLASRDAQSRLIALQGLQYLGPKARAASPDVQRLLDDGDEEVGQQAELTLYHIDQETAHRIGLVYWSVGLGRRNR